MKLPVTNQQLLIGAGILIVLILIGWFVLRPEGQQAPVVTTEGEEVATTTEESPITSAESPKKGLPPEPVFVLPEGARAIDEYAFIADDGVYFRSLTNAEPLRIPEANPDTFEKVAGFITFGGPQVLSACGALPIYSFYRDSMQVYFYQIWRAPTFRSSKIEIVKGTDESTFTSVDADTARDDKATYAITSGPTSTGTCTLTISSAAK